METFFYLRLALTAILMFLLCGCSSQKPPTIGLGILIDQTSGCRTASYISSQGLQKQLKISPENQSMAIYAYVSNITAVKLNVVHEFNLATATRFANPNKRTDEVDGFFQKLDSVITDTSQGCDPQSQTYFYSALLSMIETLQQDSILDQRLIVIVSDGQENSQVRFPKKQRFSKNYSKLEKTLETTFGKLPDLTGFTIILVYQPKENDSQGIEYLEFWKLFFESHGAVVTIKASI